MAFVRDFSLDSLTANSLTFDGTLPTYATGDMLIWFVAKDSTTGGFNTTPTGWTLLDEWSDNGIKGSVFYKENVTGGSETNPQTSNTDTDTWTGVLVSVGGVPTSSTIEANTRVDTVVGVGGERGFTGPTTLTNNALVLHSFLNSGVNGMATDQRLEVVTEEVGFSAESVYLFKETVPTAGASAAGNLLQYSNTVTTYIGVSIVDGSSGADVEPYQSSGGLTTLINGFQAQETLTWMPSGFPSGLVTDAHTTYGNLTTVNGALADRYQDAGDKGVSFYLAAASTRGDRNNYQGLRFQADRTGGLATYDISTKKLIGCCHLDIAKTSVQLGLKDVLGFGVFVEDNAGNWKVYSICGSDSERIFINPFDGPFLIDLTNGTEIDSSGTLDETNIQYLGFVVNGKSASNLNNFFSNIGIYEPIEIVGGTSTQQITYDRIDNVGFGNLHRFRKVQGGASQLVGAWHIGDGSADTHLSITGESITFPEASNNGGCLIEQGFMGFKFLGTASSNLSFIDTTISSPSQWKWDQANGLGTQTYTNLNLTNAAPFNVAAGDYSNGLFTNCGDVSQNGATFANSTFDGTNVTLSDASLMANTTFTDSTLTQATAGTITLDNVSFTGTGVLEFSGTGTLTVNVINGTSPSIPTTTTGGGTIVISQPVTVSDAMLTDGARVQLYNNTKSVELDNSVVSGGSGYSVSINLASANVDSGDTLRLRVAHYLGTTAKEPFEATGVVTESGLSFIVAEEDATFYNQYGVDGATRSEFAWDGGNLEVDITDADNETNLQNIGAWYYYYITTADGIANLFGCLTWEFYNQIKINSELCDIKLDNKKTDALLFEGGKLYRTDGASIISATTTGPIHVVGGVGPAAGSGTTDFDLGLDPIRDAGLTITAYVYSGSTLQGSVAMTEGAAGVYTATYSLVGVTDGEYTVLMNTATRRKGHGKLYVRGEQEVTQAQFFDPNFDIVQSVSATTTNLDMRGTDNAALPADVTASETNIITEIDANEVKIDALETKAQADTRQTALIAEHDATQLAIAQLNDFDPVTDVVANVALVDLTTANTDMRGTDNAMLASSWVAPDNAGIADTLTQATLARKHVANRDRIDTGANTLTRYDDDGTTPLLVFDLKDSGGAPNATSIFEKDPQ